VAYSYCGVSNSDSFSPPDGCSRKSTNIGLTSMSPIHQYLLLHCRRPFIAIYQLSADPECDEAYTGCRPNLPEICYCDSQKCMLNDSSQ